MNNAIATSVVKEVKLDDIIVSKVNTREHYDEQDLNDLCESVSTSGQIYPIVLRQINANKYELLIGTRRMEVARMRQLTSIPAIILDSVSDQDAVVLALSENLHRSDLTPFEEARAILKLCKEFNMDPKRVAKRIGKDENFVRGRLKILSVPRKVQDLLCKRDNGIAFSHIEVLASLRRPRDQIRYAKIVAENRLSKDDLVTLIHVDAKQKPKGRQSRIFTAEKTTLKLRRFNTFLQRRVRPILEVDADDSAKIREVLKELEATIKSLRPRKRRTTKKGS